MSLDFNYTVKCMMCKTTIQQYNHRFSDLCNFHQACNAFISYFGLFGPFQFRALVEWQNFVRNVYAGNVTSFALKQYNNTNIMLQLLASYMNILECYFGVSTIRQPTGRQRSLGQRSLYYHFYDGKQVNPRQQQVNLEHELGQVVRLSKVLLRFFPRNLWPFLTISFTQAPLGGGSFGQALMTLSRVWQY